MVFKNSSKNMGVVLQGDTFGLIKTETNIYHLEGENLNLLTKQNTPLRNMIL